MTMPGERNSEGRRGWLRTLGVCVTGGCFAASAFWPADTALGFIARGGLVIAIIAALLAALSADPAALERRRG